MSRRRGLLFLFLILLAIVVAGLWPKGTSPEYEVLARHAASLVKRWEYISHLSFPEGSPPIVREGYPYFHGPAALPDPEASRSHTTRTRRSGRAQMAYEW